MGARRTDRRPRLGRGWSARRATGWCWWRRCRPPRRTAQPRPAGRDRRGLDPGRSSGRPESAGQALAGGHHRPAGRPSAFGPCRSRSFSVFGELTLTVADRHAARNGQHAAKIGGAGRSCPCWPPGSAPPEPRRAAGGQPVGDGLRPLIVEAEAVDRGTVGVQSEQPQARIAGWGRGVGGADLDEAEPGAGRAPPPPRRSCRSPRQGRPGSAGPSPPAACAGGARSPGPAAAQPGAQGASRQAMRGFGSSRCRRVRPRRSVGVTTGPSGRCGRWRQAAGTCPRSPRPAASCGTDAQEKQPAARGFPFQRRAKADRDRRRPAPDRFPGEMAGGGLASSAGVEKWMKPSVRSTGAPAVSPAARKASHSGGGRS